MVQWGTSDDALTFLIKIAGYVIVLVAILVGVVVVLGFVLKMGFKSLWLLFPLHMGLFALIMVWKIKQGRWKSIEV